MSCFNKKRFTMRQVVGLLVIVFLGITVIAYAAVNIPYSFTSGNPIRASEMNDNFTAVKNAFDALETKAATLEGKVTTLESKVAALEAKDAGLVPYDYNFSGTRWSGDVLGGQGRSERIVLEFIDTQNIVVTITAFDTETGASSGQQVSYNCKYKIATGAIWLGCNLGILTELRFVAGYDRIDGLAFIGNSTLNVAHPKLTHGYFSLYKF